MSDFVLVAPAAAPQITHLEFAQAWESSNTPAEVSEKTGIDTHQVNIIAWKFRKKGIKLKSMKREPGSTGKPSPFTDKLDVEAVNKWMNERV
jgi:hypothetical protein